MAGQNSRTEAVCALLRQSILELCRSSFAYDGCEVVLDGILCITTQRKSGAENAVIKIHEKLWSASENKTDMQPFSVSPSRYSALVRNRSSICSSSNVKNTSARKGESKRKSATPLVSLLSSPMHLPKLPRPSTEKTCIHEKKSDMNDNKNSAIPSDILSEKNDNTPETTNDCLASNGLENVDASTVSSTQTLKLKQRKSGLDAIVSNLSENARLLHESTAIDTENLSDSSNLPASPAVTMETEKDDNASQENIDTLMEVGDREKPLDEGQVTTANHIVIAPIGLHEDRDYATAGYICEYCHLCLNSSSEYNDHVVACAKNPEVADTAKHVCVLCDREFADFNALSLHSRIHSVTTNDKRDIVWKGKPMTCGICRHVLHSKRLLQEHMREHTPVTALSPYSCITCDFLFPSFETFRQHRQSLHQSANNCRCERCDLCFTFKEFKTHEIECIHGQRLQQVQPAPLPTVIPNGDPDEMTMPLPEAVDKELDLRINTESPLAIGDNRPRTLNDMDNETSDSLDCSDMLSIDESFNTDEPASPFSQTRVNSPADNTQAVQCQGPYRCQSCFTVFEQFTEYEAHNHEMHSRFVCWYCAQSFASRRNLTRHVRRHTGARPYQCHLCSSSYTRDDDLKKHLRRVHNIQPIPKLRVMTPASMITTV